MFNNIISCRRLNELNLLLIKLSEKIPTAGFSPSGNGSKKKLFENTQEIYKRTPMPECDFNKVVRPLVFSCKCAAYLYNTFLQEHFRMTAVKPLTQLHQTLILGIYETSKKRGERISLSDSKLVRLVLSFWLSSRLLEFN